MTTVNYIKLNKKRNIYYTILFFVGIIAIGFDFYFIAKTIINYRIPFFIAVIVAIISTKVDKENYNNTYKFNINWQAKFYSFMQNLFTWGAFAVFLFISSNFYLKMNNFESKEFKIIEKHKTYGGKGHRDRQDCSLVIKSKENTEIVVFINVKHNKIDEIKSVTLNIREGLWGFDIYNSQKINWKE